ncbi:MAG TPA: FIST N-terminal domain-containing protein [Longimicrobiales bacterium]|nr:FIST N-terminal domain-containing protein [Longimicrobiales bacterium]
MAATTLESRLRSQAGTGFSEAPGSFAAGVEAVTHALDMAGTTKCDLVLLFATSKHNPEAVRDGVRSVVGPGPRLVGGGAVGVITNDRLGYEGFQVGAAVIRSAGTGIDVLVEPDIVDREYETGLALGRQIRAGAFADPVNLLLLYDIVKEQRAEGASLNMAAPLLRGMTDALGDWPRTAGGGLTGDLYWNPNFQWIDDEIVRHSAVGVVLSGGLRMDTITIHGCRPSSAYQIITKADGNVILELNGRPAVDVISELVGVESNAAWEDYPIFLILGVNNGDQFGEFRQDDYALRLCMSLDKERGGLAMFGDDLVPGSAVQLMRRSIEFDYVRQRTELLLQAVEGRRPVLALYIDCGGRAAQYCGTDREEAEEVQRTIGPDIPLLGLYTGCEIAKAGTVMQSHNYTGILSIFSEPLEP